MLSQLWECGNGSVKYPNPNSQANILIEILESSPIEPETIRGRVKGVSEFYLLLELTIFYESKARILRLLEPEIDSVLLSLLFFPSAFGIR
jgi:hypothetical protein